MDHRKCLRMLQNRLSFFLPLNRSAQQLLSCDVVILTALGLERQAVLAHLEHRQEVTQPQGTVYHLGSFAGDKRIWRVAVAQVGMGGPAAAAETEQAITFFQPEITFFVGIAGGLKDVKIGDVVAATKVYAYESGKEGASFEPRPEAWRTSHALEQRARAEALETQWFNRLCP